MLLWQLVSWRWDLGLEAMKEAVFCKTLYTRQFTCSLVSLPIHSNAKHWDLAKMHLD